MERREEGGDLIISSMMGCPSKGLAAASLEIISERSMPRVVKEGVALNWD